MANVIHKMLCRKQCNSPFHVLDGVATQLGTDYGIPDPLSVVRRHLKHLKCIGEC